MTVEFERGIGTFNKASNALTRDSVISTSLSESTAEKFSFSAGTKTVSTMKLGAVQEEDNFVIFGGVPEALCGGNISVSSDNILIDLSRQSAGEKSTVYFAPRVGTGYVRLLRTTRTGILFEGFSERYVDRRIEGAVSPVTLTGYSGPPFTHDTAKLPTGDGLAAFRPADVFVYEKHDYINSPDLNFPYRLFRMNWHSASARNNGNAGSPIGHSLAESGTWTYLDTTGANFSAAYITDTRAHMKLPRKYLYLGTVVGDTAGTTKFYAADRLIWNRYSRMAYESQESEQTTSWRIPLTAGDRNVYSGMNAAAYADGLTVNPWKFNFANGMAGSPTPSASLAATCIGNCRAKIRCFNGAGGDPRDLVDAASAGVFLESTDYNSDAIVGDPERAIHRIALGPGTTLAASSLLGYRSYRAIQALGSNPGGSLIDNPSRAMFFGSNKPIDLRVPGIILVGDGQYTSGPARMVVTGEC